MKESTKNSVVAHTPGVRAAAIASRLAKDIGLPVGNKSEPNMARMIERDLVAAASDMLKALEAIQRDCIEVLEGREPLSMELIHAIANGRCRTAIAKVRGQ